MCDDNHTDLSERVRILEESLAKLKVSCNEGKCRCGE